LKYRPVRSQEVNDEGFLVIGSAWRALGQRWRLLLSTSAPIRITADKWHRSGTHAQERCVLLVDGIPPGSDIRAWLERLRIEHQESEQSFPFLIGAIDGMYLDGVDYWSPEAIELILYPELADLGRRWVPACRPEVNHATVTL
jgi:hypothetical protein